MLLDAFGSASTLCSGGAGWEAKVAVGLLTGVIRGFKNRGGARSCRMFDQPVVVGAAVGVLLGALKVVGARFAGALRVGAASAGAGIVGLDCTAPGGGAGHDVGAACPRLFVAL